MEKRWFAKSRARILAYGWRLALYEVFCWVYDNPLYASAFIYLGMARGWAVMTLGSVLSCAYMFWRYDRSGVDWLFAKAVREWEEKPNLNWLQRKIANISRVRNGRWGLVAFVLLNTQVDPLIVAVHFRNSHFSGITRRDWGVLLGSVAVANLYWGIRIGLLVKILVWLWKLI